MFELIFAAAVIAYFSAIFYIITGLKKRLNKNDFSEPFISVIVPIRNEEKRIESCVESLKKLSYNPEKYEVIFVNDDSTDDTENKVIKSIGSSKNFFIINVDNQSSIPEGKARALDSGILKARGEYIFITDADCKVHPDWLRTTITYYTKETVMVCGFSSVNGSRLIDKTLDLDLMFLLGVASGMVNNYHAVSCIGNNISFRKSAYFQTGGYQAIRCGVNEDFYLLQAIKRNHPKGIVFPPDSGSVVFTDAPENIFSVFEQKKRWASTMKDVPASGILFSFIALVTNFMCLFSGFYISHDSVYLLFLKFGLDYYFLKQLVGTLFPGKPFRGFILFELYFLVYMILLPFTLFFSGTVKWKGRSIKARIKS